MPKSEFTRQTLFEQLGNDASFIAELAEIFQTDYPGMMREIREAISRGDAASLVRAAHSFKGVAGTFGAKEATEAASKLELIGRSGSVPTTGPGSAAEAYQSLEAAVQTMVPVLASFHQVD
jgi:HPt (histidine-containing phosphotransfer) domain-containing protein